MCGLVSLLSFKNMLLYHVSFILRYFKKTVREKKNSNVSEMNTQDQPAAVGKGGGHR